MFDLANTMNLRFVDLTYALNKNIPHWHDGCGFNNKITLDYSECDSDVKFRVQYLDMFAGIGTHMDAPSHCKINGTSIADIPLTDLIRPCIVINVENKAHESYQCSVEDIELFEQQYGQIDQGIFVIIHTGWGKYWNITNKYRNNLLFPSVSIDAAKLLLSRNIVGIGIDTLSPDIDDSGFPVHKIMLENDKYSIENIANSDQLPAIGAYIIALPIKISDGTEAPIRLVGLVNQEYHFKA